MTQLSAYACTCILWPLLDTLHIDPEICNCACASFNQHGSILWGQWESISVLMKVSTPTWSYVVMLCPWPITYCSRTAKLSYFHNSLPAQSDNAPISSVCTSHWLENFHCHSMLATPIEVTTRVAVCCRMTSGAHLTNYSRTYYPCERPSTEKQQTSLNNYFDITIYISSSEIPVKDYGKKWSVWTKDRRDIVTGVTGSHYLH